LYNLDMRIYFISLGCPKNLTDSEEMMGVLAKAGHSISGDINGADTVIINTCGFLASAARESSREIARALNYKKAGIVKRIIATGCLVQRDPDLLRQKFPQLDAMLGIEAATSITDAVAGKTVRILPPPGLPGNEAQLRDGTERSARVVRSPAKLCAPVARMTATLPHSVYLKIADGCDNRCAYCAIPMIRGVFRSKSPEDVLDEARALAANGAKEISLIAQDTTLYGMDLFGKPSLAALLRKLVKINGVRWRIMYAYPDRIDEELVDLIAAHPQICRYIDMPVQHASDNILKLMNRRSTAASINRAVELLRKIPGMALRTTFITGFPGETQKDFDAIKSLMKRARFESAAFFAFSPEKGTPAYNFTGKVPAALRKSRADELARLQSRIIDDINKNLIGKTVPVLMDSPAAGRMDSQAPDIDGYVEVKSANPLKAGDSVMIKITSARGYVRQGTAV